MNWRNWTSLTTLALWRSLFAHYSVSDELAWLQCSVVTVGSLPVVVTTSVAAAAVVVATVVVASAVASLDWHRTSAFDLTRSHW